MVLVQTTYEQTVLATRVYAMKGLRVTTVKRVIQSLFLLVCRIN